MSLIKALNHRLLQCCFIIISRSLCWHSKHWGHLDVLTPCSSSLSSCSGTLGELRASLRHWILSSGMTYSSTSFSGRPRAVPCLAVDGMASSRMAPRSVVSWERRQIMKFHPVNCRVAYECVALYDVLRLGLCGRYVGQYVCESVIWFVSTHCLSHETILFQNVKNDNQACMLAAAWESHNIPSCCIILFRAVALLEGIGNSHST